MWRRLAPLGFALLILACVGTGGLIGCGEAAVIDSDDPSADGLSVVPHGKEDNFFAPAAREYLVEGTWYLTLQSHYADKTEEQRVKRVKRLLPFKQIAFSYFLNAYIAPKDKKDKNASYGGFNAVTKNASFDDLRIEKAGELTYSFTIRQEMGGPEDLLQKMPVSASADGSLTFGLVVGKVDNVTIQKVAFNDEWYHAKPWKDFKPENFDADLLETIELTVTPQPRSLDAWPEYSELFADGKVSIGIHFGWDYNNADHLKDPRRMFYWLSNDGFERPVSTFNDMKRDSGPFTKTIQANGKPVEVEVFLHWPVPGTDTDPDTATGGKNLEKDMVKSLEKREVIIFSGHSGPFYGFALANWKKTEEGDLDDSKIPGLDLPDFYQIVLAEGCETYALGQAFWDNPAKASRTNLDIITTTTYSTAYEANPIKEFLSAVVGTWEEDKKTHVPWTYGELLKALDWGTWDPAMYGVHGIDDNPHLHPYADPAFFCDVCDDYSDCGAEGNFCVSLGTDGRFCTGECTGDDGCPDGYTCAAVAREQSITGRACVPLTYQCTGDAPVAVDVLINEVLADPPNDETGDANEDGWYDADEDEFVEIVNSTGEGLKLGGWTLSDDTKVRFTFPNVTLKSGGAAVVFGGGDTASLSGTGALLFVSDAGLQLGNGGDAVILRDETGRVVSRVVFGGEAGKDRSLVRAQDGDPDAAMIPHPGVPFSPGTASDYTLF